jgi:A/G-specific adenine glycosylase
MAELMKLDFSTQILNWFDEHGRKDLPWQENRSAYRVWVSEIMLQQTQVKTVIPYFERFMSAFPTVIKLATANVDEVLHHWSGLGYYARARNLHKAAQQVCEDFDAKFPQDMENMMSLPGIGRSTAAAILAQAHGFRHAILDGNVKRVLTRFHGVEGWPGNKKIETHLWQYAEQHTPEARLADYTQGMMDLGATLCRRSKPDCEVCPLSADCVAFSEQRTHELPTSKPKKTKPIKSARMLVLMNDKNQILLEKRPPTGIWGGLWSLPEMAMDADIEAHCQQQWQFKVAATEDAESFRHTFSHYHFDITPCRVQVKNPDQCVMEAEQQVWYNSTQNHRLGLAAPVQTILNSLSEE